MDERRDRIMCSPCSPMLTYACSWPCSCVLSLCCSVLRPMLHVPCSMFPVLFVACPHVSCLPLDVGHRLVRPQLLLPLWQCCRHPRTRRTSDTEFQDIRSGTTGGAWHTRQETGTRLFLVDNTQQQSQTQPQPQHSPTYSHTHIHISPVSSSRTACLHSPITGAWSTSRASHVLPVTHHTLFSSSHHSLLFSCFHLACAVVMLPCEFILLQLLSPLLSALSSLSVSVSLRLPLCILGCTPKHMQFSYAYAQTADVHARVDLDREQACSCVSVTCARAHACRAATSDINRHEETDGRYTTTNQ